MNVDTIAGIVRKLLPEAGHHFGRLHHRSLPALYGV